MTQITIINILDKIRSICKDCNFAAMPQKISSSDNYTNFESYLRALQGIRLQFMRFRALEDEYAKLQQLLQKQETEIRRRIGIQNQIKIYSQALKTQVQQIERQKLQLLENTKIYIKQLKKTNQGLFLQLAEATHSKIHESSSKSKEKTPIKSAQRNSKSKVSRHEKSQSHYKSKKQHSIKEILKTQYIQRSGGSNSGHKQNPSRKKYKNIGKQVISDGEGEGETNPLAINSKTFQIFRPSTAKKEKVQINESKKKNKHLYSNPNFFNFNEISEKKLKKGDKKMFTKSPIKSDKKKNLIQSRIQNGSKSGWKQKKLNRSIYSVLSIEQGSQLKETI